MSSGSDKEWGVKWTAAEVNNPEFGKGLEFGKREWVEQRAARPGEGWTDCTALFVGVGKAEFTVEGGVVFVRLGSVSGRDAGADGVEFVVVVDQVAPWLERLRRMQIARGG